MALISNGINRNFSDSDLLIGVIQSLVYADKMIPIGKYMDKRKPGEINMDKIEKAF